MCLLSLCLSTQVTIMSARMRLVLRHKRKECVITQPPRACAVFECVCTLSCAALLSCTSTCWLYVCRVAATHYCAY